MTTNRLVSHCFPLFSIFLFVIQSSVSVHARFERTSDSPEPVVLWHGMGDTCCGKGSMGYIKKFLETNIGNGVYVKSLMIGSNQKEDFSNSYFMNTNDQIDEACKLINADEQLKNGFSLIGFSQGGQFGRALAQRCPSPPIFNLITFGAQHQGVYGFPRCPGENGTMCDLVRRLLNLGAYTSYVQKHLVQAQYWHDPLKEDEYRSKSLFLAEINNENTVNQTYRDNLLKLRNFIMIKFNEDSMVDPRESELFGFYVPGQGEKIEPLEDTDLYKEDRLGLKQLKEANRLITYSVPGDHLQIDMNWFKNEIIAKYLR